MAYTNIKIDNFLTILLYHKKTPHNMRCFFIYIHDYEFTIPLGVTLIPPALNGETSVSSVAVIV